MRSFQNRIAVVTGAGSGIGRALSLALAREGCTLAICDVDVAKLSQTEKAIAASGVDVSSHQVDVSDKTAMEQFAEDVMETHHHIHVLVNNAGIAMSATVEEMTLQDFRRIMEINFWGVVYGTKVFLPHLKKEGEAHVVNMSSLFGLVAPPHQSAYSATKFAIRGFTESLNHELRNTSVGVSCVHPGFIKTDIAKSGKFISGLGVASRSDFIDQFDAMAKITPAQAAHSILDGIKKNKTRILIGWDTRFYDLLQRLLPVHHRFVYDWYR
ncbi:MAG: SDR family NAD(P)-dependent oxidoreductase [Fidelibacterota bacterium]